MERPCCRQSRRKGLRCTAALCIFISQIVPRPPHCCNFFLHNPQDFQHNSHNDSVRDPGGRLPSGAAGPGRPVLQALQAAVRARPGAGGGLSRRSALPHQGFAPVFPKKSRPGHRDGVRKTENPPYDLDHTEDYFCAFIPLTCWRRMEIRRKHSTLCRSA